MGVGPVISTEGGDLFLILWEMCSQPGPTGALAIGEVMGKREDHRFILSCKLCC